MLKSETNLMTSLVAERKASRHQEAPLPASLPAPVDDLADTSEFASDVELPLSDDDAVPPPGGAADTVSGGAPG